MFASARRAGILPAEESGHPKVSHVGFGLVLGEDGKRFRTRASEVCAYVCMTATILWLRLQDVRDPESTTLRQFSSVARLCHFMAISPTCMECAAEHAARPPCFVKLVLEASPPPMEHQQNTDESVSPRGQVVRLVDLLDEAKARCKATIAERRAERGEPISEEARLLLSLAHLRQQHFDHLWQPLHWTLCMTASAVGA